MRTVIVSGGFDDIRSMDVRFLQKASASGEVHALLWTDAAIRRITNAEPSFPQVERLYFLEAIRYVHSVHWTENGLEPDSFAADTCAGPHSWLVRETQGSAAIRRHCSSRGIEFIVVRDRELGGFPVRQPEAPSDGERRRRVLVTGCFDWLHSGHIRFFEEASGLGELCVVVGHDANIRLLKGKSHPLFAQDERRYMVDSIRYVNRGLISSGHGWMDAAPEIDLLKPDIYAVNEDGDVPEKREFCRRRGLEYVVLKRTPKEGLPRRQSTAFRGF